MKLLGIAVVCLLLGLVVAQWWMKRKAKRLEGRPVPALGPDIDACLQEHGRALLYFFSPNCGPCRKMTPLIDAAAERHGKVFKFDVSQSLDIARKLGVMATPTTVLISGSLITHIDLGPLSASDLEARLTGD